MRLSALLRIALAYWPAALVALLVAVLGAGVVSADRGLWAGRVELTAVAPSGGGNGRGLGDGGRSLVDFAALVERQYVGRSQPERFASDTATLAGSGVTEGSRVLLANDGGQWADNFNRPTIIVESVSRDRGRALDMIDRAVAGLRERAARLQATQGVTGDEQITLLMSPPQSEVQLQHGSKGRAAVAVLVLAALAAMATAWIIRRRRHRLDPSRSQVPGDAERASRERIETTA
jgi:hypothetical protein